MIESFHDGALPVEASYADDGGGSFVVTVVKGAEDGDGYVVRGFESAGSDGTASVALLGRTVELDIGANAITTVRVPRDPAEPVRETNLLEQ
jgi:alpha-mannosidase